MSRFNDLPPEEQRALEAEFNRRSTTWGRRVEIATMLQGGANEAQMGRRCPRCNNFPFYAPHDEALIEGHVYSHDGMVEATQITGYCEYCFDLITKEPDHD